MNRDDNTPTLGVPIVRATAIAHAPHARELDEQDLDLGIAAKDLRLFDAYWHALAVMASEDPRPNTPEEQAADDELYARCLETMSKSPTEVLAERKSSHRP